MTTLTEETAFKLMDKIVRYLEIEITEEDKAGFVMSELLNFKVEVEE